MVIRYLALLLLCQLAGEVVIAYFHWPVPGPVLGMVLLFCGLLVRGGVSKGLGVVTENLLRHLSLLFVPAGVGVMLHASKLADQWVAVVVALVASAVLTLAATAWTLQWLLRNSREDV